jgi:hypothetical protein
MAFDVEYFHRVVPERRYEQAVALQVDREMVNAAFDPGHFDRRHRLEHRLACTVSGWKCHGKRQTGDQLGR